MYSNALELLSCHFLPWPVPQVHSDASERSQWLSLERTGSLVTEASGKAGLEGISPWEMPVGPMMILCNLSSKLVGENKFHEPSCGDEPFSN